jgi:hypothetical protein
MGLYSGGGSYTANDTLYLDNYTRGSSFTDVADTFRP